MKKIITALLLGATMTSLVACGSSQPEQYPSKAVQVIITANAGGGVDITERIAGQYIEEELGQSLVPVNVAGAGGATGMQQVLAADPDGYTVLYTTDAIITANLMGMTDAEYTDFKFVGMNAMTTNMCFVTSSEFQTFDEFVEYAKAHPGELKYGVQTGTYSEQLAAMMWKNLGIDIQIIDIGTISDIVVALVGGHVDMASGPMSNMADYVEKGDFVVHGMLSEERDPNFSEIPTMYELGVDFHLPRFYGYMFSKDVPDEIVKTFADAVYAATQNEDYIKDIEEQGYTPAISTQEETLKYVEETKIQYELYQAVLEEYYAAQ